MQRHVDEGVVIACDFTGTDWDEHVPMIEGHRGSVICLDALAMAIEGGAPAEEAFECTMCRRRFEPPEKCWRHADPPEHANPDAVICWDCVQQADKAFSKDPDTNWDRKLPPSDRWR